ncbi:hypothetical protein GTQ99_02470 [Kineococcus sp. T13]|uniref:hypothetical protein n=1 Tax=Kineococcus vitellinus TaxID=2696565 RepID=UPI0014125087|nr:hypothetical protein [Kineococcus vitellinus]NAZ74291.1 hypothetical protein [Kineococcus vitellinus]
MGIAWVEAARLARANRSQQEELEDRQTALQKRAERERQAQEQRRREVYEQVLVPFRDVFARLKNIDLAELASIDLPSAGHTPQVEVTQVRLSALQTVGALAGGLGAGAGAGVGTVAAVTAFAAASTGTSISALSGAAASSATLAWLGGGSLAAGGYGVAGGTIVLGGLVAAPAILATAGVLIWQGRRHHRRQRETAEELTQAEVDLARAEDNTAAVIRRSRQVRTLLTDLQAEAGDHLEKLRSLVDAEADYALYTPDQRAQFATTVSLMTTTISVMATALADEHGVVSDLSGQVVDDARQRLQDLAADRADEHAAAADTAADAAAEAASWPRPGAAS